MHSVILCSGQRRICGKTRPSVADIVGVPSKCRLGSIGMRKSVPVYIKRCRMPLAFVFAKTGSFRVRTPFHYAVCPGGLSIGTGSYAGMCKRGGPSFRLRCSNFIRKRSISILARLPVTLYGTARASTTSAVSKCPVCLSKKGTSGCAFVFARSNGLCVRPTDRCVA